MLETKEHTNRTSPKRGSNGKSPAGRKEAIDQSVIHLLHRASQRASEIFALETRDFDLTARQYAVIATISRNEGLSQTDLVRLTGIDRSTLADVVQRLLKRRLILRARTPRDGRTYSVSLSDEGRAVLQSIKPSAKRADRTVKALFGHDVEKVTEAIEQLIGTAENDGHHVSSNGHGGG